MTLTYSLILRLISSIFVEDRYLVSLLQIERYSGWTSAELPGLPQILRLLSAVLIISFAILFLFCFFYSTLICFRFHFQRVIETQVWFKHDWTDVIVRAATFAKEDKEHLEDLRVFAATMVSPTEIIQIFLFSLHARYVSFFLDNNNLLTEYFKCKQTNALSDKSSETRFISWWLLSKDVSKMRLWGTFILTTCLKCHSVALGSLLKTVYF